MSVSGTWQLTIATTVGAESGVLDLTGNSGVGDRVAQADADETLPSDPVLDQNRLTWAWAITTLRRLYVGFDLAIGAGTLTGMPRSGLLPALNVTGQPGGGAVQS